SRSLDRELGGLGEAAGEQDTLCGQPAVGGGAGAGLELSVERAAAHCRGGGELADGWVLGEVIEGPGECRAKPPAAVGGYRLLDELRPPAVAVRAGDQGTGEPVGDLRAAIRAPPGDAQGDPGG